MHVSCISSLVVADAPVFDVQAVMVTIPGWAHLGPPSHAMKDSMDVGWLGMPAFICQEG